MNNFLTKLKELKNKFEEQNKKIGDVVFPFIKEHDNLILLVVISIFGFVLRYCLLDCVSGDYKSFLSPWYKRIYEGGFKALGTSFGDYTPAYYYLLWFISLFKLEPGTTAVLHGIKYISIFFDYSLAIGTYCIVKFMTNNKTKASISYTLIIFGLTIFLNSAWWAQCDGIYVSFLVWTIYFMLKDKCSLAMVMYGFAFCFKLQSIFILPAIIVLILKRQFKIRYLLWVPIIYSLVALPSCFASSSFFTRFSEIWSIYVNQSSNSYSQLTLNCGTLYALIFTNFKSEDYVSSFSLFLAIAIIGTYIFMIFHSNKEITKRRLLDMFILFALLVPYVLPHMHERYLYLGDALIVIYVVMYPKRFYLTFFAWINSMIGYMVYLWNIPFINVVPQEQEDYTKALSFRFGAMLYLACISFISYFFFKDLYSEEDNDNVTKAITNN